MSSNEHPFRIDGRTALVTGAGRGLGRATARALAAAGASVLCAYQRDDAAADRVVGEIRADGGQASAVEIDVRSVDQLRSAVSELRATDTTIDILVNNAAIRPRQKLTEVTPEVWDEVFAVNLRGPFFLSQAVLPDMLARGWGRIVSISGIDAYRGGYERAAVSASKIGLVGLTRALAVEAAPHGVTVNTVVPGIMDTTRREPHGETLSALLEEGLGTIPVGRLGHENEVAHACLFLASEEAGYITGQELFVTGGAHPLVRMRSRETPFDADP